jgi:hypothetical protein
VKGIFFRVIQGMGFCEHGLVYREKNYFPVLVNVRAFSLSGDETGLFNVLNDIEICGRLD